MSSLAVVLERPGHLALRPLDLAPAGEADVTVEVMWSGISTGTEKLLWTGRMPPFPGMGYPLVPGYETVGRVVEAGALSGVDVGARVFVPGARCFGEVRGLFGGAASRLVTQASRVVPVDAALEERGVLLALAATAHHAAVAGDRLPDLVVGHGVLGRLIARTVLALGGEPPAVWERDAARARGGDGYAVLHPDDDERRDYRAICDVSGDSLILDSLIARLAAGGEIVLAGFYEAALSFTFPPAFMREARIRVAAEWRPDDIAAVSRLVAEGRLSLDGLITHRLGAGEAERAYRTAFGDPSCLKMILDWRRPS